MFYVVLSEIINYQWFTKILKTVNLILLRFQKKFNCIIVFDSKNET